MPASAKIDLEQVVALRAAGEGVRAIARALAVAPSSISRIVEARRRMSLRQSATAACERWPKSGEGV